VARVLLVGYDPETVDYSNPALPPGMSAEKIRAGIALTLKQMTDRGWEGDLCFIRPNETAGQTVEHHLACANYACVAIDRATSQLHSARHRCHGYLLRYCQWCVLEYAVISLDHRLLRGLRLEPCNRSQPL
jgi:hypothetical protein